jgi:hypothetical protein
MGLSNHNLIFNSTMEHIYVCLTTCVINMWQALQGLAFKKSKFLVALCIPM